MGVTGCLYFVGLDLGPPGEFTALAVLERPRVVPRSDARPAYALRHLRRFPPATPYPEVIEELRDLLHTPPLVRPVLVVDMTGVGPAVVRLVADGLENRVNCLFVPVTVVAGLNSGQENGRVLVSKVELVGTVQVLLQTRRLHVAKSLPHAETLARELEWFRMKVPATTADSAEAWRERPHHDLVFAIALAAWAGESALPLR